ncbi:DUF58 domain-containing protein [Salinisphaera sp. Q1T1-3]|uniref:DUF58 domain-containing protein n=1 Tax=Salinisphaera sp. Q1T1-3 TaxID=2321229 RepID=UPI001313EE24|nr:DUF58 domain-containing protein [Salinisphaera sp. Q1T1-3]
MAAPRRGIGGFVARQIDRRTPRTPPPLAVSPRRLYILPTAACGLFALLLLVMTLGATNYGNNLAFVLTFWLGAVGLVSMHRAHRNLSGLTLDEIQAAPVFAGDTARLNLVFTRRARRDRRRLGITLGSTATRFFDVGPHTTVEIDLPTTRRGRLALPTMRLESRYPLGLFRCWTQLAPDVSVMVHPRPHGDSATPTGPADGAVESSPHGGNETEFAGLRAYRDGDPARDIDWKHSARRPHLLVRERARSGGAPSACFDYGALDHLALEARLSQLALWIVEADAAGRRYELVLPEARYGPDQGPRHRRVCLDALAVFS